MRGHTSAALQGTSSTSAYPKDILAGETGGRRPPPCEKTGRVGADAAQGNALAETHAAQCRASAMDLAGAVTTKSCCSSSNPIVALPGSQGLAGLARLCDGAFHTTDPSALLPELTTSEEAGACGAAYKVSCTCFMH